MVLNWSEPGSFFGNQQNTDIMNIDDLTFGELKKIAAMFTTQSTPEPINKGFCVVILDRGFIYIGTLIINGDWCAIKNARNLRSWSSGKGLQWHIEEGGKESCIVDGKGTDYECHISKLQNWAKTDESKW